MLELKDITLKNEEHFILEHLDLSVKRGSITGLIGPHDEAKSEILRIISGIRAPDSGELLIDDAPVNWMENDAYLAIGYMPRQYGFYENLRVEEYFDLFLSLYHISARYRERRIREVLKLIRMESYREAYFNEIPEEKKPFLCLGKTILHEPAWLLLDNPFAELSAKSRQEMERIILELNEMGMTILINSVVYPDSMELFTDVAVIDKGKVVANGSFEEVYHETKFNSPIRMKVMEGLTEAILVLKEDELVERVTVIDDSVIFRFKGGEKEEAELLRNLVEAGSLIQHYQRDPVNLELLK